MTRFEALDPSGYELPPATLARLLSPALVVHLDRVRENLARVIALLGGDVGRWRPHVKTTKLPPVWAELARAGLRHFKCATLREARVLAEVLEAEQASEADVLLAQPLVGPPLAELERIARAHPSLRFSVLCEDPSAAPGIPAVLGIFADLDPGMHRTGIALEEEAAILALARAAGPRFRGLHCYEGQRHESDLELRRRLARLGYERLVELVASLSARGIAVGELVTSGTPAFQLALEFEPFAELEGTAHRVSPGTVVFHDLRSERENPGLDLVPAAVVLSRVLSRPRADIATCDAGSKSIAAEAGDPCAFVLGRPELLPLTPSEEHLPLRVLRGTAPSRGTPLYLVPRHICPTVNLAEEVLLVDRGAVVGRAAVSARAHELLRPT